MNDETMFVNTYGKSQLRMLKLMFLGASRGHHKPCRVVYNYEVEERGLPFAQQLLLPLGCQTVFKLPA